MLSNDNCHALLSGVAIMTCAKSPRAAMMILHTANEQQAKCA